MEATISLSHPVQMVHSEPKWRKSFLRDWREFRGLSLYAASEPMELSHGQLSRIERGVSPYSQKVLEVAAEIYGCTVQDLLTRPPTEGESLFSIWSKLNADQRRYAAGMLRGIVEADKNPQ